MSVEHSTPPVRTPDPLAGSRRRALERLGRGLRAMGLGAIGDIGSANMNRVTASTIGWSSSSDWDNAVEESYVSHASDVISMTAGVDSFEDLSTGDPVPSVWNPNNYSSEINNSVSGADGSLAARNFDGGVIGSTAQGDYGGYNTGGVQPDEITFSYYETSSSGGIAYEVWDTADSSIILRVGSANPEVGYNDNGDVISSPSPEYENWRRFTITFDWTNQQFDILWEDLTGSTSDQTVTGVSFMNPASGIGAAYVGSADAVSYSRAGNAGMNGNEWWDAAWGVPTSSTLTTATKSFAASTAPDLQNLSYTLNSQEIVLDVIGSPGTASEEIVSQTLDGSTGYSLTWSNTHTDFRVRANLNSLDRSTSPTFSAVELLG